MIDLRRCSKTAKVLEERGIVLDPEDGKPRLTGEWLTAREQHVRGAKKEHKERQDAVRGYGAQHDATAFLGWVLLTDPWRHVRAEAVHALARHEAELSPALIALALADRSKLVVRAAQAALTKQGGLTAFLVLVALWEDRGAELDVFQDALLALARRTPQSEMRSVLPRLEQESRKFFILPARRRRLRELAEALDRATAHLKDLPLTAMASVESANLPLPTQTLPALREDAEGRGGWVRGRWVRGRWVQKLKRFFGS